MKAADLTPKEKKIFRLIGLGRPTKEIAGELEISHYTVSNHRKNIYRKLGVHGVAELVAHAATAQPKPSQNLPR